MGCDSNNRSMIMLTLKEHPESMSVRTSGSMSNSGGAWLPRLYLTCETGNHQRAITRAQAISPVQFCFTL